jgi:CheY-like chemotaxis protein
MPKKILLIENDAAIASELSRALEARGLEVRVTGDGKEGLELARDARPDAVVLCVELPRMSGYSVCQKLKKDEALRSIPVVLTSAEATEDTFEAHKKLKARADEYLIKPYAPAALLQKLSGLIELPEAPAEGEELVTLDDVEELSGEMPLIPVGEQVRASDALPDDDEDLKLLDSAFDSIAGAPGARGEPAAAPPPAEEEPGDERPVGGEELRAAADLLPAEDEVAAHAEIDKLGEEADRALEALGAEEPAEGADLAGAALLDEPLSAPAPRAPAEEPLGALHVHRAAPSGPPTPPGGQEPDAQVLRERVSELLIDLARAREQLQGREAELEQAHRGAGAELEAARAEAEREAEARRQAEEALRRAEEAAQEAEARSRAASERAAELEERGRAAGEKAARLEEQGRADAERAARLQEQLSALQLQVEEGAQAASLKVAQLAALESEVSGTRSQLDAAQAELDAARAALDGTRADAERRSADLQKRVQELEAVNAKHEERVVKAYQKIKSDEKIREKTRKALAIALQLLDERIAASPKEPGEPVPRRE